MTKTLVGPQLRQLRRTSAQTQAQMAKALGISPAYVNLLENNQRSVSVKVLMALTEVYGVDWRDLINDGEARDLADLRAALRDPAFTGDPPDLQELRAAFDHAPRLAERFMQLYRNHRKTMSVLHQMGADATSAEMLAASPETAIHDFFRDHENHFAGLERAADAARIAIGGPTDEIYTGLKRHLGAVHGIETRIARRTDMPDTLRLFDAANRRLTLSESLDPVNRSFQIAHVLALVSSAALLDTLIADADIGSDVGRARCRIELANYFAAALLMPYDQVLTMAEQTHYDVDAIATAFGVSFEQVCQRLTTLQRDGARGVAFFFLRLDKAGNVTKRFNATPFTLAEQGGSCPVWNIHTAFRTPGAIVPQFVELPEGGRYFTVSRTTARPVVSRQDPDRSLVVTLGCEQIHMERIGYARQFNMDRPGLFARIGINCHVCPRQACSLRAHEPMHINLTLDANRRGSTRYES